MIPFRLHDARGRTTSYMPVSRWHADVFPSQAKPKPPGRGRAGQLHENLKRERSSRLLSVSFLPLQPCTLSELERRAPWRPDHPGWHLHHEAESLAMLARNEMDNLSFASKRFSISTWVGRGLD